MKFCIAMCFLIFGPIGLACGYWIGGAEFRGDYEQGFDVGWHMGFDDGAEQHVVQQARGPLCWTAVECPQPKPAPKKAKHAPAH